MLMFFLLLRQNFVMFCYLIIGCLLYKKHILSKESGKDMGKLLLYLIMPSAILNSYLREYSSEMLKGFLLSFGAALGCLLLSMAISALVYRKGTAVRQFGAAFSNAGFIGIPLVQSMLGEKAVFYVAPFVALLNIFQWTYGIFIMTNDKKVISGKKLFTNPIVISLLMGLAIFFFSVPIPDEVSAIITTLSSMNGPLAMLVLGTYLAQISLKELFLDKKAYLCTAIRLIVIPFATAFVLGMLPNSYVQIRQAVFLAACAPVGSNVAIFAQIYGQNYQDSIKDICLSTFFCMFILPVMGSLADAIWKFIY